MPAVHDPAKVWRRRLRVGSHAWAERRDGTWVRWSWLHADWQDMPGPPEGVRAAPPEGSVMAAPPAFATAPPNPKQPRTLAQRFKENIVPVLQLGVIMGGALTVVALGLNGIFGGFLEPIPIRAIWLWAGVGCVVLSIVAVVLQLVMIRVGKGLRELFTPGPKGRRR